MLKSTTVHFTVEQSAKMYWNAMNRERPIGRKLGTWDELSQENKEYFLKCFIERYGDAGMVVPVEVRNVGNRNER